MFKKTKDFSVSLNERQQIREAYKNWQPRTCPYRYYDWVFTPIEWNVWDNIRYLGLPFYPQWPVEKYFIDFADPVKKIGIEVDGKEWHVDHEKDQKRQDELESLGWMIIRIEGKKTFRTREDYIKEWDEADPTMEEEIRMKDAQWRVECSEGILADLRGKYYSRPY